MFGNREIVWKQSRFSGDNSKTKTYRILTFKQTGLNPVIKPLSKDYETAADRRNLTKSAVNPHHGKREEVLEHSLLNFNPNVSTSLLSEGARILRKKDESNFELRRIMVLKVFSVNIPFKIWIMRKKAFPRSWRFCHVDGCSQRTETRPRACSLSNSSMAQILRTGQKQKRFLLLQ